MANYKRIQGDSLWIDIQCDDVNTIDPSIGAWPTNWSGKWEIDTSPALTGIITGNTDDNATMFKSATTPGLFQLRIGPSKAGWNALPVGTYILTIEIRNQIVDYCKEQQCKLTISAQGIVN